MSAAAFTGWAVEALIASTILMVFVLLVRKDAQRLLGTQLAYCLWALPALRMAMPPLPANWRESAAAPITAASETVMVLVEPMLPTAPTVTADPFPWALMIGAAWVLGALAFFVWHGLAHASYVRRIVSPPARHVQLPDGTTLVESDEASGPVAFGVLKRFVAVPKDFAERYDADERKLALAHELGHHARGDLIANWIGLAALACHWFNPIAWVAYRKFRADQEMANDARVLSALPPIERHAYACAIVKAAHGRAVTAACHLHTIEDLKGRLRMLKASRKSQRVVVVGAVGIASLTIAGLGLTASGAAAEKLRTVAETQVVAMAQTTVPTPPVAPGAPPAVKPDAWAADAPAGAERKRKVVIVKDGKTETYEGAAADAYIASRPELHPGADDRRVRAHRIVINRDGQRRVYEGAAADAYLKAHPEMIPPEPPVPPVPGAASVRIPPVPSAPTTVTMVRDGKNQVRSVRVINRGYAAGMRDYAASMRSYATAMAAVPEVIEGSCSRGDAREFVRNESRDGKQRMIICTNRIERFAESQARSGKRVALSSLIASRAAIEHNQGLSDGQRARALSGIDEARAELEREIRDGNAD